MGRWAIHIGTPSKSATAVVFALVVVWSDMALSHGGGLDANGCHNESATGQYHCHDGPLDGQSFESEAQALAVLRGEGERSSPGLSPDAYDRDLYGGWTDADGDCQDTRQEILIAQGDAIVLDASGCRVRSGIWIGPYTGERFADPSDLHIDHIVPLADAHESGASGWSGGKKRRFSNDPFNLLAVQAGANMSKGARDPAEWLPERGRCSYTDRWVRVKERYDLSSDDAERRAIEAVEADCM